MRSPRRSTSSCRTKACAADAAIADRSGVACRRAAPMKAVSSVLRWRRRRRSSSRSSYRVHPLVSVPRVLLLPRRPRDGVGPTASNSRV